MVLKVSLNTGINRIRLEFKVHTGNIRHRNISIGINRIRLEFKVVDGVDKFGEEEGINRIILEFKERMNLPDGSSEIVLIESYWNLKVYLCQVAP